MVKIHIRDETMEVACIFMKYNGGRRMWMVDKYADWYPTVGAWCPHHNIGNNECLDCSLVLEGEEE